MNILITGIHGFVGSNLVKALKGNHTIYGLDIVSPEKDGIVKTFSWQDLDNGHIPEIDAIIHLAGKAHDTKNKSDADVYFKINTDLTKKIYDYFTEYSEIKKFIFFSSVKAAVDKVENDILTEDVIPCPVGPYGESKIKAEEYIMDSLKSLSDSKEAIILRPCMIHGPNNKGNLNLLYGVIKKGVPWPLGSFENKRSFTSIDNLTFVIEKILSITIESGIYNMSDDKPLSTNDLIRLMCEALGKQPRILNLDKKLIRGIAKIGDFLHLPLNSFRLNKLTENYVVSNDKIKKVLGIGCMPVDSAQGIIKTIRSFT